MGELLELAKRRVRVGSPPLALGGRPAAEFLPLLVVGFHVTHPAKLVFARPASLLLCASSGEFPVAPFALGIVVFTTREVGPKDAHLSRAAIVGDKEDQGVLVGAFLLQLVDHASDVLVHVVDLRVVDRPAKQCLLLDLLR